MTFSRHELDRILNLYGRMVAIGEWRDYAIDFLKDRAVFSVFRRASEMPIYRIKKDPKLARKQGAYSVISATGLIVRRGHELDRVLRAIDKPLRIVAGLNRRLARAVAQRALHQQQVEPAPMLEADIVERAGDAKARGFMQRHRTGLVG